MFFAALMEKTKLAPKAWPVRIRAPRFIGLEMRSAPMAKKPRMSDHSKGVASCEDEHQQQTGGDQRDAAGKG